jgi:hypothetical protein
MPAALQLTGGKLISTPAVAHASPSRTWASFIYLKNSRTHTSYLVETGAAVSLLYPLHPSGPAIINGGGHIPSWSFLQKQLH